MHVYEGEPSAPNHYHVVQHDVLLELSLQAAAITRSPNQLDPASAIFLPQARHEYGPLLINECAITWRNFPRLYLRSSGMVAPSSSSSGPTETAAAGPRSFMDTVREWQRRHRAFVKKVHAFRIPLSPPAR